MELCKKLLGLNKINIEVKFTNSDLANLIKSTSKISENFQVIVLQYIMMFVLK